MAAVIPPVSRLSSRIIRILGCNPGPMTLQGTNTYLIGTGKKRILLDTGEKNVPQYITNLKKVLHDEELEISRIVLTHWHGDHVGGVEEVFNSLSPTASISKYRRKETADDFLPSDIHIGYLNDGEEIKTEGATLRVVHTPGHTTDHVVLTLAEENALFSGDCILGEGTAVFEDLHDYMKSLSQILDLKPQVIYPGHGPVVEDPIPKIAFYIDHRNKRENAIMQVLMKEPLKSFSAMDIVKIVYTETPEHLHPAAAVNVEHHLTKLQKENRVHFIDSKWQVTNFPRASF